MFNNNVKKIKLGIYASQGRMGKKVLNLAKKDNRFVLKYEFNKKNISTNIETLCKTTDVIIDFSSSYGSETLIKIALNYQTKLIICSTGLSQTQKGFINQSALKIPILYSENTTLGLNILAQQTKYFAQALPQHNIKIIDIHHKYKKDSPSGSAILLAKFAQKARVNSTICSLDDTHYVDTKNKIIIQSIREKENIGIHKVIFSTEREKLYLCHEITTREAFAQGALDCAYWLCKNDKKPIKLYNVFDVYNLN